MILEYDPQADAIYIQLREGEVAETVEISKYVYVDVDKAGRPLGIEILFVTRHLALEDLVSVTFNIPGDVRQAMSLVKEDQETYDADEDHGHTSLNPNG